MIVIKTSKEEVWAPIDNFPNYEISNFGRVRNPRKILKLNFNQGYLQICLCQSGKQKVIFVHKLVLETFGPSRPKGRNQCNHIDGDKTNNYVHNLEWCTRSQNMRHAIKMKLFIPSKNLPPNVTGQKNGNSKLKETDVRKIRDLISRKKYTQIQIAKRFNIHPVTVCEINKRKIWGHLI